MISGRRVAIRRTKVVGSREQRRAAERKAAALRREAHEIDHEHVTGVDDSERDVRAEELRARADRLDGSGS